MKMKTPLHLLLCSFAALTVATTGCVKDDIEECFASRTFTVVAFDDAGAELGKSDVREVILYVFDGELHLIKAIPAQVGQKVTMDVSVGSGLHIAAWGNTAAGLQFMDAPAAGDHKDNGSISLLSAGTPGGSTPPDDLFYGEIDVADTGSENETVIPIRRAVGSMAVTVRGLKEFTGFDDEGYSIAVRGSTASLDFHGDPADGAAVYRPAGSFVAGAAGQEWFSPAFNVIPTAEAVIEIYHGAVLVTSVSRDASGSPIAVVKGRLTNVLIELHTTLDVSVALTDWGKYALWKEF
ncbi:MAG: FimB/Mfa2 family fimbrial subunit [Tannerellaceae bacterium]|jgi:hypothetical protein|nr:FimB/Mfa2 family fimbrial subunit [Tannerellaceae bacterium]